MRIASPNEPILNGIPIRGEANIMDALAYPNFASSTVHIPEGINDPTTILKLRHLNGLLSFVTDNLFRSINPSYTMAIQHEIDATEASQLPAKLEMIRNREFVRFQIDHLPD